MCSIHVAEESTHTGTAEFIERMDQLCNAFNSQTLTSPALMQHALTVTSCHKVFLLGILNWLSKIKSKGKDGSILILLDVVSFVVYILDYYMYQVDLNLSNITYFDFLNQIKARFFKHPVYAMTYTWLLLMSFECHISIACLLQAIDCTQYTVYGNNIIKTILLKHDVWLWHNNGVCFIYDRYSEKICSRTIKIGTF